MHILRLIIVIAIMLTSYSAAAHAFGDIPQCPMSKMGKMMDCCKEKSGAPQKCPCGSCSIGMTAPAALLTGITFSPPLLQVELDLLPPHELAHISPTPNFRPPVFLA
jgi:hypothetical protein